MSTTMTLVVGLTPCCVCGGPIALEENQERVLRNTHETFYCPRGHRNVWKGAESPSEKAAREKAEEKASAEIRSLVAQRDGMLADIDRQRKQINRMEKRAIAGVCLKCHRHFANVERHVASKHPKEVAWRGG